MQASNQSLDLIKVLWHSSIVVKMVLAMLLTSSLFSWAIIFKKWKFFKNAKFQNDKFYEVYSSAANIKEVVLKSEMLPFSPFRQVFLSANQELVKMKEAYLGQKHAGLAFHFQNFGLGIIERGLKKGSIESLEVMNGELSYLASIGSITPFIGLFGTVWGIIDAFAGLSTGGGSLESVAPGIAEALVTTALGLLAAIPAVWFYNYFNNVSDIMTSQIDSFGQEFLNIIERSIVE